jgi:Flp pilus assembly protein TadG
MFFRRQISLPSNLNGRTIQGFASDQRGATAVEFALVVGPFLMMMFGIINTGLYYYSVNCVDRGVDTAARQIRTGEAQKAGMTVSQFKTLICNSATSYVTCSNLSLKMQFANDWSGIAADSCVSAGSLAAGTGQPADSLSTYVGAQEKVVMITACYKWTTSRLLPFLKLSSFSDGSMLIQSATAFKTEPYL